MKYLISTFDLIFTKKIHRRGKKLNIFKICFHMWRHSVPREWKMPQNWTNFKNFSRKWMKYLISTFNLIFAKKIHWWGKKLNIFKICIHMWRHSIPREWKMPQNWTNLNNFSRKWMKYLTSTFNLMFGKEIHW